MGIETITAVGALIVSIASAIGNLVTIFRGKSYRTILLEMHNQAMQNMLNLAKTDTLAMVALLKNELLPELRKEILKYQPEIKVEEVKEEVLSVRENIF